MRIYFSSNPFTFDEGIFLIYTFQIRTEYNWCKCRIYCNFNKMDIKPNISSKAFWDTNFEALDYERNKDYIIAKVFEFGKWKDISEITKFYGEEQVKQSLVSSFSLSNATFSFASAIFKIPKEQFKCYEQKQFQKSAWPF
jgi:hypothetical protein